MEYAPIIIFAFNRLESLKACVSALQKNSEATLSDLIVYVDGPRFEKRGEKEKVQEVRNYVKSIKGFKSLEYHFSDYNKKLGPSIIAGVTECIRRYGKAIVIEDDLIASENMLTFVNNALKKYENIQDVFSISAYTNIVKIPSAYSYDAYMAPRSSSWGWATWQDRWDSVDWNLNDWDAVKKNSRAFNHWGGSDCFGMLNAWKKGKNQSWAIRFCYAQFLQNKKSVFPIISKIANEGFDGEGTNCKKWSRFKYELDKTGNKVFRLPEDCEEVKSIVRSALSYHSVFVRIYSRIMYMIYE